MFRVREMQLLENVLWAAPGTLPMPARYGMKLTKLTCAPLRRNAFFFLNVPTERGVENLAGPRGMAGPYRKISSRLREMHTFVPKLRMPRIANCPICRFAYTKTYFLV